MTTWFSLQHAAPVGSQPAPDGVPPTPRTAIEVLHEKGTEDATPWEYRVEYVRLFGDVDPVARGAINRRIREVADTAIADFRRQKATWHEDPPLHPTEDDYQSKATAAVTGGRYMSIVNESYMYFSGAAHGSASVDAMVFDLTNGAEIGRDALFKPGADYLSALALPALRRAVAECGPVDLATIESELRRRSGQGSGVPPAFSLTESAVRIDFQHYAVGPGACGTVRVDVPFTDVRDVLAPELLAGPPLLPAPPGEPCTVSSSGIHLGAEGSIFGLFLGGDGWVDVAARSDNSLELALKGRVRVGLEGVFGTRVAAGGNGGGAAGTVGAGLQAGVATTFGAKDVEALRKLVAALDGTGPAPATADGVSLLDRTMEMGVWLSGDIGLGAASASTGIEGVIGATVSYANEQPAFVTYYLVARGNLSAVLDVMAGKEPTVVPSVTASAGAEHAIGVVTDLRGRPLTLFQERAASLQGSLDLASSLEHPERLLPELKKLAVGAKSEEGHEVRLAGKLDLADPAHLAVVEKALGVDATETEFAATARLVDEKGRHTIELREVRKAAGDVTVRVGGGPGLAIGIAADHTTRHVTAAAFKPPGANPRTWTTCWGSP